MGTGVSRSHRAHNSTCLSRHQKHLAMSLERMKNSLVSFLRKKKKGRKVYPVVERPGTTSLLMLFHLIE